ncbi:hypothetical protein A3H83_03495 [Candidatus Roizmanbacteria bacterium RIFCSPLOWO2_02_FULL_39_8]|uniref:Uncharacterized protein n=1 Tax=Candidatus Roizmanbacteria bacterium RIFCSPHIGHO2_01_FULL_39_24 TaxID=1802032 RepID=A0A1F7GF98_9BACT|nr:MAG: hypothetical protein A2799_04780 [Candidatus Roizmanbacteria bacterium RIFCSPHIGHO2_01_FULL_39_24]OGK49554.1 MAG: hypothetical protein A3A56_04105 [Candidatus Roizmanbacteria bacterium RIFCSPLOWO2_01_FULL_40_32]OGK56415.1 MAG: hypothetical protein A3H83_03495 [Candidatus Roizmanbacteria bacterium RIFCSPLOWO2_02_FULL_39_8]
MSHQEAGTGLKADSLIQFANKLPSNLLEKRNNVRSRLSKSAQYLYPTMEISSQDLEDVSGILLHGVYCYIASFHNGFISEFDEVIATYDVADRLTIVQIYPDLDCPSHVSREIELAAISKGLADAYNESTNNAVDPNSAISLQAAMRFQTEAYRAKERLVGNKPAQVDEAVTIFDGNLHRFLTTVFTPGKDELIPIKVAALPEAYANIDVSRLTNPEEQVLRLIGIGIIGRREIAFRLGISVEYVDTLKYRIRKKSKRRNLNTPSEAYGCGPNDIEILPAVIKTAPNRIRVDVQAQRILPTASIDPIPITPHSDNQNSIGSETHPSEEDATKHKSDVPEIQMDIEQLQGLVGLLESELDYGILVSDPDNQERTRVRFDWFPKYYQQNRERVIQLLDAIGLPYDGNVISTILNSHNPQLQNSSLAMTLLAWDNKNKKLQDDFISIKRRMLRAIHGEQISDDEIVRRTQEPFSTIFADLYRHTGTE